MRELQDRIEHLQRENNRLRAQVEKKCDLGEKDVQDSSQAKHPTARNKGKESIILENIDTPTNDELSSGRSSGLSPAKFSKARSRQRHSHHPTFNNANGGTFCWARRETVRGQNQPNGVTGNALELHSGVVPPKPPVYHAFRTSLCFTCRLQQ